MIIGFAITLSKTHSATLRFLFFAIIATKTYRPTNTPIINRTHEYFDICSHKQLNKQPVMKANEYDYKK